MRTLATITIILSAFLIGIPVFGLDFTVGDFDPAPPDPAAQAELAESMRYATLDLVTELTVVAVDDAGVEHFTVLPLPMEFMGLMTQAQIVDGGATTAELMMPYIDDANSSKPGPNHFDFIIDGESKWVNGTVAVFYITDTVTMEGVGIPVGRVNVTESGEDGKAVSEWILIAETPGELDAFLQAPEVKLVVDAGDGDEMVLDIGHWRRYGLFDLRTLGNSEPDQPSVESIGESVIE